MNSEYAEAHPGESAIEARVHSYEVAASMQLEVPEIADLKAETEATRLIVLTLDMGPFLRESFGRTYQKPV